MTKKLLTIVSNAKTLTLTDGTSHPSGFWAEELCVPYEIFEKAGYRIDVGTLGGIAPSVDRSSLDPQNLQWVVPPGAQVDTEAAAQSYQATLARIDALAAPLNLDRLSRDDLGAYRAIYIAGGHGCMEDMPASPVLTRLLLWAQERNMPIASVCHGPTAFLAPRASTGQSPFEGYRMTCFSHAEEFFTPINGKLPLVLEIELKRLGIHYSRAPMAWGSHVVVDRNVVTGQNPHSSEAVARTFVERLG